jgi:putative FmdB family regulatory protein
MPLYDYECVNCERKQEAEKPYEQRREMEVCESCGSACEYVVSPTAGYMKGGPTVPSNNRRMKK